MLKRLPSRDRVQQIVRSSLFTSGFVLSTLVYAPIALFAFPLPYLGRYQVVIQWTRFNLWWLKKTCRLDFEVRGLENIPSSPSIVFAKHQSTFETLALQLLFRPQAWVLKRELLWIPFFGWALAMLRPIAINRKSGRRAVKQVVDQGRQRLEEGAWVIVFPEGTRVAPGVRKRYLMGGAILAEKTGFPVVPVAHNAGEFWPRRGFIKRPGTVCMVIGAPIESKGRRAAEVNQLAELWIEREVTSLSGRPCCAPLKTVTEVEYQTSLS